MKDVEAVEDRDAPKVRPKFPFRSEPVQGPRKLSRKKGSKSGKGKLARVVVETPELWDKVEDLRKVKYAEEAPEENSMELDVRHKELAACAGNR